MVWSDHDEKDEHPHLPLDTIPEQKIKMEDVQAPPMPSNAFQTPHPAIGKLNFSGASPVRDVSKNNNGLPLPVPSTFSPLVGTEPHHLNFSLTQFRSLRSSNKENPFSPFNMVKTLSLC